MSSCNPPTRPGPGRSLRIQILNLHAKRFLVKNVKLDWVFSYDINCDLPLWETGQSSFFFYFPESGVHRVIVSSRWAPKWKWGVAVAQETSAWCLRPGRDCSPEFLATLPLCGVRNSSVHISSRLAKSNTLEEREDVRWENIWGMFVLTFDNCVTEWPLQEVNPPAQDKLEIFGSRCENWLPVRGNTQVRANFPGPPSRHNMLLTVNC